MGTYNAGVILNRRHATDPRNHDRAGRGSSKMISGIAGLGHMSITAGMILLFIMLRRSVSAQKPVQKVELAG